MELCVVSFQKIVCKNNYFGVKVLESYITSKDFYHVPVAQW